MRPFSEHLYFLLLTPQKVCTGVVSTGQNREAERVFSLSAVQMKLPSAEHDTPAVP